MPASDDARYDCAVIFTGHMIDLPGRATPRFPPRLEGAAREAVADAMRGLMSECGGGGGLIGLSSAARGGDLLFLEVCEGLGAPTEVVLPFAREKFAETSVKGAPSGDWLERYEAMLARLGPDRVEVMNEPDTAEAYDRCNLRLLEKAEALARSVTLLALLEPDALHQSGGAAHFAKKVRDLGGRVIELDIGALDGA